MFSLSKTRHLMSFDIAAQTPSASAWRSCLPCTQHLWPETCLLGASASPDYSMVPKGPVQQGTHAASWSSQPFKQ